MTQRELRVSSAVSPTLLHFHIFKNGGTTLDWILERNFGAQFAETHGPEATSTLFSEDIARIVQAAPDTIAFSSHHFRFPLIGIQNVIPLAFVRHPMDRIPSMYEQERRCSPEHLENPAYASLTAWVENALNNSSPMVCDSQVSFYARGGIYYEPPSEDTLLDAMDVIDSLDFVGIVSEYIPSMVLLEHILRPWWPEFDAAYFIQNQSAREPTLEERLTRLQRLIQPDTYRRLLLNNRYDLALFEHAKKRLHERCAAIPDFESRVADLSLRCQTLR